METQEGGGKNVQLAEVSIPMPSNEPRSRAQQALAAIEAFAISGPSDYERAASMLKEIKTLSREIDDNRKLLKRPIDEAAARVQEFFREPLVFLARAEATAKRKLTEFQQKQERARIEAQRQADERARKERERLEERARAAAAAGKPRKAVELAERADMTVAPIVQAETPKVAGISTRELWKWRVTDESAVPREYLALDERRIGAVVRALKGDTRIAGIEVYPEHSLAAGSNA